MLNVVNQAMSMPECDPGFEKKDTLVKFGELAKYFDPRV